MDAKVFDRFRQIVYERSGISLGTNKEALVSARVGKRMRALGLADHRAYLEFLVHDAKGEEYTHLIDAISTNVTSFFRESAHFDFLGEVFAKWCAQGQRRFRFWSAASSTGEEPYTMAVTLLEAAGGARGLDVKILATDISTRVLEQCLAGRYEGKKLDTMAPALRQRYFTRCPDAGDVYEVKPALRNLVVFRRLNLSRPPFPMRGPLDAVFCRNVMIYFDMQVRTGLVQEAYRLLKPGGYLFVGHAESLTGIMTGFKTVRPSVYLRP